MALTNKLEAIAEAIRDKTGKTDKLTLDQMPAEIESISGGGEDLPPEAFNITGSLTYRFSRNGWNWFLENYANKITTTNITSLDSAFYYCNTLEADLSGLQINCSNNATPSGAQAFSYCSKLRNFPVITNCKIGSMSEMFYNCYMLREFPEGYFDSWDFSDLHNNAYVITNIFSSCRSLRRLPSSFLSELWTSGNSYSTNPYNGTFMSCYALDEVSDIGVGTGLNAGSQSLMSNFVSYCYRLKKLTFATNEDGSAKTANWGGARLNLSQNQGWSSASDNSVFTNYNSGITADKNIGTTAAGRWLSSIDDVQARYNELKNDPDWYIANGNNVTYDGNFVSLALLFSRYNHDSAVETINSLPDTSAYLADKSYTNIITFKNYAGALTDGGGINDLTDAEKAVAAAKGWTVSIS